MANELQSYYSRPAMIIFCKNEPSASATNTQWNLGSEFLYLTDQGRDAVNISYERIETKERMIDGTMRSYFISDKRKFSTGWTDLPSRKNASTSSILGNQSASFTADGFAAGQDILDWYNKTQKDFWMLLVYDAPVLSSSVNIAPSQGWAEKVRVFFDSFNFDVTKRGYLFDLWNVEISLVEA